MLTERVGKIVGWFYVLAGVVGFIVTGFAHFASTTGHPDKLLVFAVNPLHNIINIVIGILLIGGANSGINGSRAIQAIAGVVFLLLFVVGLAMVKASWNVLAVNQADNLLHLATAVVLLGVGLYKQPIGGEAGRDK